MFARKLFRGQSIVQVEQSSSSRFVESTEAIKSGEKNGYFFLLSFTIVGGLQEYEIGDGSFHRFIRTGV